MWAGLMLLMLWQYPAVSEPVFWVSLVFPVYYFLLSFALHFQARRLRLIECRLDDGESVRSCG